MKLLPHASVACCLHLDADQAESEAQIYRNCLYHHVQGDTSAPKCIGHLLLILNSRNSDWYSAEHHNCGA